MKNKLIFIISTLLILTVVITSVKYCSKKNEIPKYDGKMDTEVVKYFSNKDNFSTEKLDSLEFIDKITSQKLQEFFDLLIVSSNNEDKKLQPILKNQLKNYFLPHDTLALLKIKKEIDSMKISYAKLNSITILKKDSLSMDSIGSVNFSINLYKKDKTYLTTLEKSAKYVLKKNSQKMGNEFKYYFSSFGLKDTIRVGVTK